MKGKVLYAGFYGTKLEPVTDNWYPRFVPEADKFFDGQHIVRCFPDSATVITPVFDAEVDDTISIGLTALKDDNILVAMGEYGEQMAIYNPDGQRISDWHSYIVQVIAGKYLFEKEDGMYLCDEKGNPIVDKVIQSSWSTTFDKNTVMQNIKDNFMGIKGVTDVYIFKDTYKFIGENRVYVEVAIDNTGSSRTGVYDAEVSLSPDGSVYGRKITFSWWMDAYSKTSSGVEFGVEEDVVAFLQGNTFVGASGMKVNFVGSCMYMNGARVTGPLRVILQPGIYSTAKLVGSNATLTVNGATGEIINNADGNVYRKE